MKTRKSTKVTKLVPKEDQEQIMLANWLRKNNILFTASANGGSRNWLEAIKLKRMGVSKGFPDIFIPIPMDSYHGLFLELKRVKGGVVSDHQRYWLDALNKNGYRALICFGFEDAKEEVENYLGLVTNTMKIRDKIIKKYSSSLESLASK